MNKNTPPPDTPHGTHLHTELTAENWHEQLWQLSLDAAHSSAKDLGPEACLHLAFATLQHYFLHTYATALPFLEEPESVKHYKKCLALILEDAGISLDLSTVCQEIRKEQK